MPVNEARTDPERRCDFIDRQHARVTQSIIARHESVASLDTSDDPGSEQLPLAGAHRTLVQTGRDLPIRVLIQQPIELSSSHRELSDALTTTGVVVEKLEDILTRFGNKIAARLLG